MDLFGTQEKGQKRRSQQNGSEFKNLERGKKKPDEINSNNKKLFNELS